MQKFLDDVAEILEVDGVTADFRFREIPDWNSLKGFSLLVLLESEYGAVVPIEAFLGCQTVGDLAQFLERRSS